MKVNGRATEQDLLPEDDPWEPVAPGPGHEDMIRKVEVNLNSEETRTESLKVTIKPPERPL